LWLTTTTVEFYQRGGTKALKATTRAVVAAERQAAAIEGLQYASFYQVTIILFICYFNTLIMLLAWPSSSLANLDVGA
jgi:hypothetical protein